MMNSSMLEAEQGTLILDDSIGDYAFEPLGDDGLRIIHMHEDRVDEVFGVRRLLAGGRPFRLAATGWVAIQASELVEAAFL